MSKYLGILMILSLFLSFSNDIKAQNEDREHKMPEGNGTILGIVIDKANNQFITGAAILVFKMKDSSKTGGTETDKSGKFSLEVPYGRYRIEVNMVGYKIVELSGISVFPKKPDVTLDTIKLKLSTSTTEEIEVTTEKNLIEFTPEKKIFNVEESPLASNGSATDVLKNVPSVSVDNDGNVSLRGSQNVRILLDGRPLFDNATNILESIPASSVQSIELITNPSAKYEAEGETGFINVVLKKSEDFGYNGTAVLSVGDKDKYNASANINLKSKKLNIFGNYSFQSSRYGVTGTSTRENIFSTSTSTLDQPSSGNFRILSNLLKAGLDYKMTDKQTISFSSTMSFRNRSRNNSISNGMYDNNNAISSLSISNNDNSEKGFNYDAILDYSAKFKNPKQELKMEAAYSHMYEDEPTNIINQYFIINYDSIITPDGQQSNEQMQHQNVLNYQADYTHPFGKDSKFETGFKSTYRYNDHNYSSQHLDSLNNIWINDAGLNNEFKYRDFINALYVAYSDQFGDLGIHVGLRSELTFTKGELINDPSQNFTKHYIDFFPSASLSEKLGKSNEFQLSYTRRLNRPRGGMLNPFKEVSDPYNVRMGNPNLNPEYIDSYELSYLRYLQGAIITSSVFFRETHGLIARYRTLIDSLTSLTQPVNLSKAYSYGFELIANLQTPQWLNVNGSFSYYKTEIIGSNIQAELSNSGYSWTTKFLASAKMWFGLELSMIYNYNGKRPTVDGYMYPMQNFDVSLKKVFFGKKLDIAMRVSDVLNSQEFKIYTSNTGYNQTFSNKRESRVAYLTLTYRFGNLMENERKGRDRKHNNEDTNPPDIEY